ncbi:MAG: hypothetical protein AB7L13_20190 [Acidimicrobiia bacterium]
MSGSLLARVRRRVARLTGGSDADRMDRIEADLGLVRNDTAVLGERLGAIETRLAELHEQLLAANHLANHADEQQRATTGEFGHLKQTAHETNTRTVALSEAFHALALEVKNVAADAAAARALVTDQTALAHRLAALEDRL